MNLSQCLLYRDIVDLSAMAAHYNCPCNRNSKLELVQALHNFMMNKANYREMLSDSDQEFLYFTTYILFLPVRCFTINELIVKGKTIVKKMNSTTSPRIWIATLLKLGWLFPSPTKYQVLLEIPIDLHSLLKEEFIHYWFTKFQVKVNQEGLSLGHIDEGNSIVIDLVYFLAELQKSPLPLTVDGQIYKKKLQSLLQGFQVKEQLINEKSYRFGYGRRFPAYPNRFALIYDFCFAKGWMIEQEAYLEITLQGNHFLDKCMPADYQKIRQDIIFITPLNRTA